MVVLVGTSFSTPLYVRLLLQQKKNVTLIPRALSQKRGCGAAS